MNERVMILERLVPETTPTPARGYRAPTFEVISLDCEITSYAPAGDDPLF
jgi:hypothetical protein